MCFVFAFCCHEMKTFIIKNTALMLDLVIKYHRDKKCLHPWCGGKDFYNHVL